MKNNSFLYFIFALTIFIGSFLLFQVQPIIGKYILPWFGGTSFVWITSLLFFQILLLIGYLYAYLMAKLPIKRQMVIHIIIVMSTIALTLFFFSFRQSPILPTISEKLPDTFSPIIQVSAILLISICLPYFLLSTTSTLLQKWFSFFPHTKSPYALYSLSNIASLLAIISYPLIIEPVFPLHDQGLIWSISFLIFSLFLIISSLQLISLKKNAGDTKHKSLTLHIAPIAVRQILLWLSLSGASSLMLLAATNQITKAIAPIPFLWLLPLGLYLLSFILCFSEKNWYWPRVYTTIFFLLLCIILALFIQPVAFGVGIEIAMHGIFLFSCFMLCHGKLYASRPSAHHLNLFYLYIALGSVLGASIVAIIAPIFFIGAFWEYYLALYIISLLAGLVLASTENTFVYKKFFSTFATQQERLRFVFIILTVFFVSLFMLLLYKQSESVVGVWRSFYGNLRVTHNKTEAGTVACLLNGSIIHGCQFLEPAKRSLPITYYGKNSGLTLAEQSVRQRQEENKKPVRIGGIGLGIGTTAAFGRKGDVVTFYELNPQDLEVAESHFTYLKDSAATVNVVLGDGRLALEKELEKNQMNNYNLFFIDAFNDDSIPVHLLTKEAFELYIKHLDRKNGIIAVHISNNYIDLIPVMVQVAKHFGMHVVIVDGKSEGSVFNHSRWVLLSFDLQLLKTPAIQKHDRDLSQTKQIRLWTDDYSNVFQLLKY